MRLPRAILSFATAAWAAANSAATPPTVTAPLPRGRPFTCLELAVSEREAGRQPARVATADVYVTTSSLLAIDRGTGVVTSADLGAATVAIIDTRNATFLETSLPFKPASILSPVSALEYLNRPRSRGPLTPTGQVGTQGGRPCVGYGAVFGSGPASGLHLCTIEGIPAGGPLPALLEALLLQVYLPGVAPQTLAEAAALPGVAVLVELTMPRAAGPAERTLELRPVNGPGVTPVARPAIDTLTRRTSLSIAELDTWRIGPQPAPPGPDEAAVRRVISSFNAGYARRELDALGGWVAGLLAPDVLVIGTDAAWPGSWEWRSGHAAAQEMFERDWRRWGAVRLYEEDLDVRMDGDVALVAAFGTVTRPGNDAEASRRRALQRIRQAAEADWESRRALYEVLADASSVLVQYERDDEFVWPLRATFTLARSDGRWLIRSIHFSHPSQGFRSWRLLEQPEGAH